MALGRLVKGLLGIMVITRGGLRTGHGSPLLGPLHGHGLRAGRPMVMVVEVGVLGYQVTVFMHVRTVVMYMVFMRE